MKAAWFLSTPGLFCLFVGLIALVLVFLRLKSGRRAPAPEAAPAAGSEQALTELASEIGQLRLRLDEVEQRRSPLSDWPAAGPSSVNLNRRGQVMRLYRRGDTVAHIASTLGLSTGEVALIVKVQEMVPPARGQDNPPNEL